METYSFLSITMIRNEFDPLPLLVFPSNLEDKKKRKKEMLDNRTRAEWGVASTFRFRGKRGGGGQKTKVDTAETTVTLIARKPAAEEETSLVNIEGIKATLLMEWAFKGRPGIGPFVHRTMTSTRIERWREGSGRRVDVGYRACLTTIVLRGFVFCLKSNRKTAITSVSPYPLLIIDTKQRRGRKGGLED